MPTHRALALTDAREALHAAGLRPNGRDPRTLTDAELEDALASLGVAVQQFTAAISAAISSIADYYARVGDAIRTLAAHVERDAHPRTEVDS